MTLFVVKISIIFAYIMARTSIFLVWKESLNSDSQQFRQYQQNEQSHLPFSLNTKKTMTHVTLEIQVMAWYTLCMLLVHK